MDALFNISKGSKGSGSSASADGKSRPPDLETFLGSAGGGMADTPELRKMADDLWKHLDHLSATDPAAYKDFMTEQAKEAGVPVPAMMQKDGGSGGTGEQLPSLVLETSISGKGCPQGALALVHIWAAAAAAGMPMPFTAGPVPVSATTATFAGLQVPLRTMRAPTVTPHTGGRMIYSYHLLCHADAVHMAAIRTPEAFCPLLVEAACQFVQHAHKVVLSRTARRLQVNVEALPAPERVHHLAQHKSAAEARAASGTAAESLSAGLLSELSALGKLPTESKTAAVDVLAGGKGEATTGGKPGGSKAAGRPLIQDMSPLIEMLEHEAAAGEVAKSTAVGTAAGLAAGAAGAAGAGEPTAAGASVPGTTPSFGGAASAAGAEALRTGWAEAVVSSAATMISGQGLCEGATGAAAAPSSTAPAASDGIQVVLSVSADGLQRTVVASAHLPSVECAGDVDVDVVDSCITMSGGGLTLTAQLPCPVDAGAAKAKFDMKRRVLTVRLPAL